MLFIIIVSLLNPAIMSRARDKHIPISYPYGLLASATPDHSGFQIEKISNLQSLSPASGVRCGPLPSTPKSALGKWKLNSVLSYDKRIDQVSINLKVAYMFVGRVKLSTSLNNRLSSPGSGSNPTRSQKRRFPHLYFGLHSLFSPANPIVSYSICL